MMEVEWRKRERERGRWEVVEEVVEERVKIGKEIMWRERERK